MACVRLVPFLLSLMALPLWGEAPARWTYKVAETYPHDRAAFTQGLHYDGTTLFLGTGRYGASSVRRVDLASGRAKARQNLHPRLFGEGVTLHGERLFQLTWKSGVALVYDAASLELKETLRYRGEGWGITSDGHLVITSDGSDTLTARDPETFAVVWRVGVTLDGRPLRELNELEYIDGRIYANVWKRDEIMVINPTSGVVEATLDCSALTAEVRGRFGTADVLNGIAYDARHKHLLVTGKYWDRVYALEVIRD